MKKTLSIIAVSCVALLTACSDQGDQAAAPEQQPAAPAQATAPAAAPAMQHPAPAAPAHPTGHPTGGSQLAQNQAPVTKVSHAAGYTYMEVDLGEKTTWVASSPVNVKTGDTVAWTGGAVMHNFTSKSLRRTFDEIVFVNTVSVVN